MKVYRIVRGYHDVNDDAVQVEMFTDKYKTFDGAKDAVISDAEDYKKDLLEAFDEEDAKSVEDNDFHEYDLGKEYQINYADTEFTTYKIIEEEA